MLLRQAIWHKWNEVKSHLGLLLWCTIPPSANYRLRLMKQRQLRLRCTRLLQWNALSCFVAISCATVLIKSFVILSFLWLCWTQQGLYLAALQTLLYFSMNYCSLMLSLVTKSNWYVCVMMVNDNMLVLSCRWVLREDHPVGGEVLQCWWWWTEGILHTSFWVFRKEVSLATDIFLYFFCDYAILLLFCE